MEALKAIKIAFLFVGTVIGAGFGTGRELITFFKSTSAFTLILGGIALGVFCSLFLFIGKTFKGENLSAVAFKKYSSIFDFIVAISAFCVFCAMFSLSEGLLLELSSLKFGGYFTALLCLVIAYYGIDGLEKINLIAVPSIIYLIIFVFSKGFKVDFGGGINLLSPLTYSAMNIMLAGYVISGEGSKLSKRGIAFCGAIVAIVFASVMTLLYSTVKGATSAMPFYEQARTVGLGSLAGVVIYLAVFTTALSSIKVVVDYISKPFKNRVVGSILAFLMAVPVQHYVGFENLVDYTYPAISVLGLIMTLFAFLSLIRKLIEDKRKINKNFIQ